MNMTAHIVAAAIRYRIPRFSDTDPDFGEVIVSAPQPADHDDIITIASRFSAALAIDGERGFIDNQGQFVSAKESQS